MHFAKQWLVATSSLAALSVTIAFGVMAVRDPAWAACATTYPFDAHCPLPAAGLNSALLARTPAGNGAIQYSSGGALAGVTIGTGLTFSGGTLTATASGAPGGSSGAIQTNNGTGGFGALTIGSGLTLSSGTLTATGTWGAVGSSTITGGTTGRVLYDNAGLLGELALGALATATPGAGVTTWITSPSAANFAAALVGPITVASGGTGAASITANAVIKGNGTSAFAATALSDDGTKVSTSEPIDLTILPIEVEIANASSTGTTLNKLAKLTGAPSAAVITATTDLDGVIGIVNGGAGTSSNARIAVSGQVNCVFDSSTTAGNYVGISPTVAGDCRDVGSTRPTGQQVIGRVLTTNGATGTYPMQLQTNFTPSAGAGTVTNPANLTIHAPLIGGANGTTDAKATAAMTNGQVLIGSTGADPVPATIAMGAGLNGSTGAGSFTITPAGRTAVADANCATLTNANSLLAFTTVLTAARSCTLPAANTLLAGQRLCFVDEGDGTNPAINGANTVTIGRTGSDKINGATSFVMGVSYAAVCFESDASAKYSTVTNQNIASQPATSNNFLTGIGSDGVFTRAQPSVSNISGFGTGVATALGVNVGSAGAPVVLNGALGTPSSGTGTNITGIPNVNVNAVTTGAGTTHTLVGPREYWFCTGTCTVTVPVPVAGYEFCVANNVAVTSVITLAALGSSSLYGKTDQSAYGTAGTGTAVAAGAAGDKICLIGKDSTHYNVASYAGTWTMN